MANQLIFGAEIAPANTAMEVSLNGGTTMTPLAFTTVGARQEGTLTGVPATTYAIGQLVMGAVGFPATRVSNPVARTVAGAALRLAATNATVWNNTYANKTAALGPYSQWSALHSLVASTSETALSVHVINELSGFPALASLCVLVNGAYFATLAPAVQAGEQTLAVTGLPAGSKTVQVVAGGNTGFNVPNGATTFYGIELVALTFPTGAGSLTAQPSTVAVFQEGDSINIGDGASSACRYAWPVVTRGLCPAGFRVATDGWGAKYASAAFASDALIDAYVARVVAFWGSATRKVYDWNLGTNDFVFAPSAPSVSATILRKICTRLIGAAPACEILVNGLNNRSAYATANNLGFTGADYSRAYALVSIETGITTNAKYYELSGVVPLADLPDGVHPNDAGHLKLGTHKSGIYQGTVAATAVPPPAVVTPPAAQGELVAWRDVAANVTATAGRLEVVSAGSLFSGLARGTKGIAAGSLGSFTYLVPTANSDIIAGLSSGPNPASFQNHNASFYPHADTTLSIYRNGVETLTGSTGIARTEPLVVAVVAPVGAETGLQFSFRVLSVEYARSPVPTGVTIYPVAALNAIGAVVSEARIYSPDPLVLVA